MRSARRFRYRRALHGRAGAEALYANLVATGIDTMFYDRDERPGVMSADLELIGVPHRLMISDCGLDKGTLEYKARTDEEAQDIPIEEAEATILRKLPRA